MRRFVHSHRGSAPRLSQPLSGFLAGPGSAALSSRSRPWGSSLQSVPLAEVAHPFRGRWLPRSHPRASSGAMPSTASPLVSPTPTSPAPSRASAPRWPGSPARPGAAFPRDAPATSRPRSRALPVCAGSRAPGSPGPARFTCLGAFFPPASPFTPGAGLPSPNGRCSPGVSPLQSLPPTRPRTLLHPRRAPEGTRRTSSRSRRRRAWTVKAPAAPSPGEAHRRS